MTPKRWQDAVNVVAGIWLMLSPWVLAFPSDETVLVVTTVLGAALLAAALGAFTLPQAWEKCDEILVGLAAMGAPWMAGFQSRPALRDSTVLVGALAVLMAGLSMIADRKSRAGGAGAGGPSKPASRS
jgi:hypothetical protein